MTHTWSLCYETSYEINTSKNEDLYYIDNFFRIGKLRGQNDMFLLRQHGREKQHLGPKKFRYKNELYYVDTFQKEKIVEEDHNV